MIWAYFTFSRAISAKSAGLVQGLYSAPGPAAHAGPCSILKIFQVALVSRAPL
jgi:hypothetical protein